MATDDIKPIDMDPRQRPDLCTTIGARRSDTMGQRAECDLCGDMTRPQFGNDSDELFARVRADARDRGWIEVAFRQGQTLVVCRECVEKVQAARARAQAEIDADRSGKSPDPV